MGLKKHLQGINKNLVRFCDWHFRLSSTTAWAVCNRGCVAGTNTTQTGSSARATWKGFSGVLYISCLEQRGFQMIEKCNEMGYDKIVVPHPSVCAVPARGSEARKRNLSIEPKRVCVLQSKETLQCRQNPLAT